MTLSHRNTALAHLQLVQTSSQPDVDDDQYLIYIAAPKGGYLQNFTWEMAKLDYPFSIFY
jgi:hypothetical protein